MPVSLNPKLKAELAVNQVAALGPGFHWVAPNLYLLCAHKAGGFWILPYQSPVLGEQTDLSLGPVGLIGTPEPKRRAVKHRSKSWKAVVRCRSGALQRPNAKPRR